MNKNRYRISEYNGTFTVQVYAYEFKGYFWWRRKVWSWVHTNQKGGPWLPDYVFNEPSDHFNTLEEAKSQIVKWQMEPVYHYV